MTTEPDPIVLQGQCIVSRALLKPGATIRQMFRQPAQIPADSGWRFLTGKEDEEYMDDPDNFATRELAKMVALDASIIAFLDRPAFTCLMRDHRDEDFREYTTQKPLLQKVFTVAFLAVFILAVLYSMVAVILYLPPYSWVADLQIRIFGQRFPDPALRAFGNFLVPNT